ncbi:MAG: 2-oxo acid dehydrogenase subunit E2 [Anaerolineae bacterium]|nr:2-oxo acid dehydrogenase subunit E2 [Anaerolineae bacterium]
MIHEVILPQMGQTMTEGVIVRWLVKEDQAVKKGDVLFEVESDKAVLEVESTAEGHVRKLFYPEGSTLPVLTVVALIGNPEDDINGYATGEATTPIAPPVYENIPMAASPAAEHVMEASPQALESTVIRERIFVSPRARRVAREKGIALSLVEGSGPNGRIVEADILAFVEVQAKAILMTAKEAIAPASISRPTAPGLAPAPGQTIPLAGVRARIAERMSASAHTTARVTLMTELDATRLVEVRTQLKDVLADSLGFSIGYNDLLVAICARALRDHPNLNSRIEGNRIRMLDEINVGLAVDTERGLLVPVVRNADRLGVEDIARRIREVVARAREGRCSPDELTGGTFTITSLGMYGVDAFSPIINLPECAILGVGRISQRPAVVDGKIVARQRMWLSLSFDHRVVDGAPAARFLQRITQLVEEPCLLLS